MEVADRSGAELQATQIALGDAQAGAAEFEQAREAARAGEGLLASYGTRGAGGMTHVVGHNCAGRAMEPERRRSRHHQHDHVTKEPRQMATPTGNTRIARGNRFRVHAIADGGWRIGFTTKLGYRDFPSDPATDAAFGEFSRMTTADQIDAAAGDLMARGPMTRTRALLAVSA
jgi:hypothetical protein